MKLRSRLFIGLAALGFVTSSYATIIGGAVTGGTALANGGTFVLLTAPLANPFGPPNSVGNDTFQSPNLYGFDEDQNITLVNPLSVDQLGAGGPGTLLPGTEVASHYIFFDPNSADQIGYVDFDSNILAVLTSTALLAGSDFLANTGVNYLNPAARGLELGDSVTVVGSRLYVDWNASTPGDYVRVLTAHSPAAVPDGTATSALIGLGLAAMALSRRRRA